MKLETFWLHELLGEYAFLFDSKGEHFHEFILIKELIPESITLTFDSDCSVENLNAHKISAENCLKSMCRDIHVNTKLIVSDIHFDPFSLENDSLSVTISMPKDLENK